MTAPPPPGAEAREGRPAALPAPRRPWAWAALLCVALGSPARAAGTEGCTLADGQPWQEHVSKHFVIDVAGWKGDPAGLVGPMEDLYAAVLGAMVAEPVEIPGRVRVILLPRQIDLYDYTGSSSILGLFWVSPLGEPIILLSADQAADLPGVVAHELTHHVASYLFPSQPYWFAEGLAQFLEGVAKVDGEGRRWAGSYPAGGFVAGAVKLPRMRALVAGGESEMFTSRYLASWILYRFLWNERGRQLSTYQQRLMDGAEPLRAWNDAFPEWDVPSRKIDRLDNDVARYRNTGQGLRWEAKVTGADRTFSSRRPSMGDLHLALLRLRLFSANALAHDRLRKEALEEARREDPDHPGVAAALATLRGEPVLPVLRAATAARPEDGRGWYLLGAATEDPEEREAALRRAVERWPDGTLAHAALAVHLAGTGRARAALPSANRAVELAPWSPTASAALATVALELSQCQAALTLQARALAAVEAHRLGSLDGDATALREGLAAVRRRCEQAKTAP